jgi:hypothetical protein
MASGKSFGPIMTMATTAITAISDQARSNMFSFVPARHFGEEVPLAGSRMRANRPDMARRLLQ